MTPNPRVASFAAAALLLVGLAAAPPASAQTPRARPPITSAPQTPQQAPAARRVPRPRPGDLALQPQPRYRVEAVSFHAEDESGIDISGSDEVYAVFGDESRLIAALTATEGNVDTGTTRAFSLQQNCIAAIIGAPGSRQSGEWSCADGGAAAPLTFVVALFEEDDWPGRFCHGVLPEARSFYEYALEGGKCKPEDDLIGRARVVLSSAELAAALPNVGQSTTRTLRLNPPCPNGASVCGVSPLDPDYTFTYRITRLADYTPALSISPSR